VPFFKRKYTKHDKTKHGTAGYFVRGPTTKGQFGKVGDN